LVKFTTRPLYPREKAPLPFIAHSIGTVKPEIILSKISKFVSLSQGRYSVCIANTNLLMQSGE